MLNKRVIFLSGLPRSGSTLLCAILSQNKNIHLEANSPVGQLMYGAYDACRTLASEALLRSGRSDFLTDWLPEIPALYYRQVSEPIILDRHRQWTREPLSDYMKHLNARPRCLVLLRPITEIMKSFVRLRQRDNDVLPEYNLLVENLDPTLAAIEGVAESIKSGSDYFLFGTYQQLMQDPKAFVEQAYDFWSLDRFEHTFTGIQNDLNQNDEALNTPELHEVRPEIARRDYDIRLSNKLAARASHLDEALWHDYEQARQIWPNRFINI